MSFFRPHKTKPRQFNYIPRHYDPVKEERDRRRRELHGTSTQDDEEYTPGKYIRTQREARDASRGERTGYEGLGRIAAIAIVMVLAMLIFIPRFMRFVERANEDTVVLVCHFGLECVLLSHLLGVSPMVLWHGFCASPSSVTTICTEERRRGVASFRISAFGDVSHLWAADRTPSFAARFCETYDRFDQRHD